MYGMPRGSTFLKAAATSPVEGEAAAHPAGCLTTARDEQDDPGDLGGPRFSSDVPGIAGTR
jgi:hypothetical protein